MGLKIWSKTLLNSYMCFEKIAEEIDHLVLTYGLDSCHLRDEQAYLFTADQMIELIDKKKLLINLKVICDEVIANINPKFARMLILKYVDNMKCADIAKLLGFSIRSYFRWMNEAVIAFSKKLNSLGFTDKILKEMCDGEVWLKRLYNRYYLAELSAKPKKEYVEDLSNIVGLAINSFKRSRSSASFTSTGF